MGRADEKKPNFWLYIVAVAVLAVLVIGVLGYHQVDKRICDDAISRSRNALNGDRHAEALRILESVDRSCKELPTVGGMRAEALARGNRSDEALKTAGGLLKEYPGEMYATYALAHAFWSKGDIEKTRQYADRAVKQGRGAPAHLLLGLVAIRGNDLPQAKSEFDAMLRLNPDNLTALFNLAFVEHRMNRYRHAREGYLKVLHLDPRHLDSRFNLGLLTHAAGAVEEARHHLAQLIKVAPRDERVARLRTVLAAAPRPPAAAAAPVARRAAAEPTP